ncbi:hypothetical protein JMM51_08585 [Rhodovulum sulfidophilum]|nr:hypothetical protein [Rhodovulum sulfidophilum]
MEAASHLIFSAGCSISDAAFSAGYPSLGHISALFGRRYGHIPSTIAAGQT